MSLSTILPIQLAIIRQKYYFNGGAEKFVEILINTLKHDQNIKLNLLTRQWNKTSNTYYNIHVINPPFNNRLSKEKNFSNKIQQYLTKQQFHIIQSHERIPGCDIFRAGDGLHHIWLKEKNRTISFPKKILTKISRYHNYILSAEYKTLTDPNLKKIICNSEMVKNDIINIYNIPENKCIVIYNSVNSNYFIPATTKQIQKIRSELSIPYKACVLLFIGSNFFRKGLKQILQAISFTNKYLIIIGKDTHTWYYKYLAKLFQCMDKMRFIGISKNILPYYHASDALILPSLYDPCPNVILEAMSCGLPIITSYKCGGKEFITHKKNGFICDSLDIQSIRTFINEIPTKITNPYMGLDARNSIKKYNPRQLYSHFKNLYKQYF